MIETTCPWCEVKFALEFGRMDEAGECPECLTCWSYEEPEAELALAA